MSRAWLRCAALAALALAACTETPGEGEVALYGPGTGPGMGPGSLPPPGPSPDASPGCPIHDPFDPCPGRLARLEPDGSYTCFDPLCTLNADCAPGLICDPLYRTCVEPPECATSLDCDVGERCDDGACVPDTCDEHDDCPWGVCLDGLCAPQPTCDDDADCPSGWRCHEPEIGPSVCVPIVQTCDDCAPPFVCDVATNSCVAIELPCDETCPTGACHDGVCAYCEEDDECDTGEQCTDGYCVPDPCANPHCDGFLCHLVCEATDDPPPPPPGPQTEPSTPVLQPTTHVGALAHNNATFSGNLEVIVLPPPDVLDFASPIKLITSALASAVKGDRNVKDGKAKLAHFIGHLHVRMTCTNGMGQRLAIPLTGATSGGNKIQSAWHNARAALGGTGVLFYPFPPKLDEGNPTVQADVDTRSQHPGMMSIMRFPIDDWQCRDLALFYDNYKRALANTKYDSQARPRRLEGAGCTAFGNVFIERTRLVPRSKMHDLWAQKILVGQSTIGKPAKILTALDPEAYPYGSNLVAWKDGVWHAWPKGQSVAPSAAVVLTDLDRWINGTETATPLTLFDTAPMNKYVEDVHGGLDAAMWDKAVESNGNVKVIIRKRDCNEVLPRNPDHDDLRKDN